MHVILLDSDRDTTLCLEAACNAAHIPLTIVGTPTALERAAKHADLNDFLIIECVHDRPKDIERCLRVVRHTSVAVYIVYAGEANKQAIERLARGPIKWLPVTMAWPILLTLLRGLQEEVLATRVVAAWPKITAHQHEVWALAAQGWSHTRIADEWHVGVGTVKKDIDRIKKKLHVTTGDELRHAFRWMDDPQQLRTVL
jgi:DNA-binding NarL/FixJ family response regulator